jgi:hypothetical protein
MALCWFVALNLNQSAWNAWTFSQSRRRRIDQAGIPEVRTLDAVRRLSRAFIERAIVVSCNNCRLLCLHCQTEFPRHARSQIGAGNDPSTVQSKAARMGGSGSLVPAE